ncbi:MAG: DUF1684 domain-containing protein [Candidatus Hydrogenedentota bacterium]
MDVEAWKEQVRATRSQKDAFLASHMESPLPFHDRLFFEGLAYWPPDPQYRFEVELHEFGEKEVVTMMDTSGQRRKMWRWGVFHFELEGQQCALHVYKSDPAKETMFIPFRDKTNGKESYGAGRYLDLNARNHRTKDGKWVLDLNEAYNPWCAYSEQYACPFVPRENWLQVSVQAGEKQYPLGSEKAEMRHG